MIHNEFDFKKNVLTNNASVITIDLIPGYDFEPILPVADKTGSLSKKTDI